jgi:sialidase-1
MRTLCLIALSVAFAAGSLAAEPMPEKENLFDSGEGGYAIYRIPGIVVTAKGTVLVYCEARRSSGSDWGDIDILLRRSTDGGRTFDAARRIVTPPADVPKNPAAVKQKLGIGQITVNNPVAVASRDGTVHFLYCIEYARCYYMRSDDDGVTFSPPVDLTPLLEQYRGEYDWMVVATGPGHGIELRNGRLIVPIWLSTGTGGHAHRPSCVSTIYSDDGGKSWHRGQIVANHPEPANPSETAVVELADGRVMLNFRNESSRGLRAVSIGPDGAAGWGPVRYDEALPEPICMATLVRLDAGRILFANPHNPQDNKRRNLTVKLSEDDGRTWPIARSIEPGLSAYSDLAVGPDGTIYCFYERGSASGAQYGHLCLARCNLAWLKGTE